MNALRRFIWAVKGVHIRTARGDDEDQPLEGRGIGRGCYEGDAAVMIAEIRRRFHDDHFAHPKKGGRKLNIITTSCASEGPTFHAIEDPRPDPEPEKLSLRERWRRLKAAADELKKGER